LIQTEAHVTRNIRSITAPAQQKKKEGQRSLPMSRPLLSFFVGIVSSKPFIHATSTITASIPTSAAPRHLLAELRHHLLPRGQFFLQYGAVPAAPWVEIHAIFVSYLSTAPPTTKLPTLHKPPIKVHSDGPIVHDGAIDILDTILCVFSGVINYETEATRGHLLLIQTHDDALDVAGFAEYLVNLVLGGEEGQIADVDGGGVSKTLFEGFLCAIEAAIPANMAK
jgi:hypothetical protein